jgi:hypothetical protein
VTRQEAIEQDDREIVHNTTRGRQTELSAVS